MKIILFGQLTDHTGSNTIALESVPDTDGLVQTINKLYPAMAGIKYLVAVDRKIVQSNTVLNNQTEVALLPPFSGG